MSRILHLVNMVLKYGRSKGVRESRLEEPPLGSLAATPHLTENASHHDIIFLSSGLTLTWPNSSHMDFLDDPAAIPGSKLIISNTIKDESSNEHIAPEIWANNHHKRIYSFTSILPAIFLDTIISSCACIVLLSEASSSSHVE